MNRRTVFAAFMWSAVAGGIVAVLAGENRAVSLRLWLAAFALWFAWAVLKQLFQAAPMAPSPLVPLFGKRRANTTEQVDRLREVRALHGLVLRARDNPRAFHTQLRPRLVVLAEHYLLLNHGVDTGKDPDRAAAVLGDLAWLVDDRTQERAPSLDELDRFVHRLMTTSSSSSSSSTTTTAAGRDRSRSGAGEAA